MVGSEDKCVKATSRGVSGVSAEAAASSVQRDANRAVRKDNEIRRGNSEISDDATHLFAATVSVGGPKRLHET
jgi:hypothetical protein